MQSQTTSVSSFLLSIIQWPLTGSLCVRTAVEKATSFVLYCAKPYANTSTVETRMCCGSCKVDAGGGWTVGRLEKNPRFWMCCTGAAWPSIYLTAWWVAAAISWTYPPSGEGDWKCPPMFSTHCPKLNIHCDVTPSHLCSQTHAEISTFIHTTTHG